MKRRERSKAMIKGLAGFGMVASLVFIFLIVQKLEEKKEIVSLYAELPSLELRSLDNSVILLDKEYQDEKLILVVYSSECIFCKEEIAEILENHSKFNDIEIVMTTIEDQKSVLDLSEKYDVSDIPNVTFTYIDNAKGVNWLANFKVPSIFIYNTDHKIVKFFEGRTNVDEILKYI